MPLPVASDLTTFLQGAGLMADPPTAQEALLDLQGALDAAVEELEDRTGFKPFLSSGTETTRVFDIPSTGMLALDNGLIGPPTEVRVSGLVYTQDSSYWLYPRNSEVDGLPYTHIFFGRNRGAYSQGEPWEAFPIGNSTSGIMPTISVTGVWGYSTTLPESVRLGLLAKAAYDVGPELTAAQTNEIVDSAALISSLDTAEEWEETDPQTGSVRVRSGGSSGSTQQLKDYAFQSRVWQKVWEAQWERLIKRIRRQSGAHTIKLQPVR